MNRATYWAVHISNGLVVITGLVYGAMKYIMTPSDPYAVVNHPLQPHLQHFHILVAPLFLLVLGGFWDRHAWSYWKKGKAEGLRTGILATLLLLPMIFSGYLLQVAVAPSWRMAWIWVHGITSVLWAMMYGAHVVLHWWFGRKKEPGLTI